MALSSPSLIAEFFRTRDQYRSNADLAIGAAEYRKASELLWGAITQQLKAYAATRNVLIESHRQFFDFVRQLGEEIGDNQIYPEFVALNALHKNFYDEVIPPDIFQSYYNRTVAFIRRIESLMPPLE